VNSLDEYLAEVRQKGFLIASPTTTKFFIGKILEQFSFVDTQTLRVRHKTEATRRSLTSKYGKGRFPPHTDFAYESNPKRYILISNLSSENSSRATTVYPVLNYIEDRTARILRHGRWKVRGNSHTFFASALFNLDADREVRLRWDMECMSAVNSFALESRDVLLSLTNVSEKKIYMAAGESVLIDNWRCLHGRDGGNFDQDDSRRILTRYSFG
jgi:hypothetical protein